MNCLEFRRRLGTMPRVMDAAMQAHLAECVPCRAAWQQAQHFESRIESALRISVPEGLVDDVILAQTTVHRRFALGSRRVLAIAASVLIALGAGGVLYRHLQAQTLPALAVAHMPPEIDSLDLTRDISAAAVHADFSQRHLVLRGPVPAGTTYVHLCLVGPYPAMHMVTRRDGEPVAVLYLPHKHVAHARNFTREGWVGREMPLGKGSLVLLTNRGSRAPFHAIATAWRQAIEGPANTPARAPLAP